MTDKFVVRLMDAAGNLLAWDEVQAESRPQGKRRSCPFWATRMTTFAIERDGVASRMVVHWCDLDLVRAQDIPATEVSVGQVFNFSWIEPVWLVPCSEKDIVLPAVTVRQPATIIPPTGSLTATT